MTNVIGDALQDDGQYLNYENGKQEEVLKLVNIDKTKTTQEIVSSIEEGIDLGGEIFKVDKVLNEFSKLKGLRGDQINRKAWGLAKDLDLIVQGNNLNMYELTEKGLILSLYLKRKYVNLYKRNTLQNNGVALVDALGGYSQLQGGSNVNIQKESYKAKDLKDGNVELGIDKTMVLNMNGNSINMVNMTGKELNQITQAPNSNKITLDVKDAFVDDRVDITVNFISNNSTKILGVVGQGKSGIGEDFNETYKVIAIDTSTFAIVKKEVNIDTLRDKRVNVTNQIKTILSGLSGIENSKLSDLQKLQSLKSDFNQLIHEANILGIDTTSLENYKSINDLDFMIKLLLIEESIESLPDKSAINLENKSKYNNVVETINDKIDKEKIVPRNAEKLIGVEMMLKVVQLVEDIEVLPNKEKLDLNDESQQEKINDLKDRYDSLEEGLDNKYKDNYKEKVTNSEKLFEILAERDLLIVNKFIENFPNPKDLKIIDNEENTKLLKKARNKIANLKKDHPKYKLEPDNIKKLTEAEARIKELKEIETIVGLIDALPDEIKELPKAQSTGTIVEAIQDIDLRVTKTDKSDSGLITNLSKLRTLQEQIESLQTQKQIDALPKKEDVTLDDKEKIQDIRKIVDEDLNDDQRKELDIKKLTDSEQRIKELQIIKDKAIKIANPLVDKLPEEKDIILDKNIVDQVKKARTAVDDAKAKGAEDKDITNLDKLTKAEFVLAALEKVRDIAVEKANDLVDKLPEEKDISLDKKILDQVKAARAEVDDAKEKGAEDKDITNLAKLIKAEKKIEELKQGTLELKEAETAKKEAEAKIKKIPEKDKLVSKPSHKKTIPPAREAADKLKNTYKLKPDNMKKLTEAEARMNELDEAKKNPSSIMNYEDDLSIHEYNNHANELESLGNAQWRKVFDENPHFGSRVERQFIRYMNLLGVGSNKEVKDDLFSGREPYNAALFQIYAKYKGYKDGKIGKYYGYRVDSDFGRMSAKAYDQLFPAKEPIPEDKPESPKIQQTVIIPAHQPNKQKKKPKKPAVTNRSKPVVSSKTNPPDGYVEADSDNVKTNKEFESIADIGGISICDINTELSRYGIEFEKQLENGDLLFNRVGTFFDREPNDIIVRPEENGTYKIMQEGEWFLSNDKELEVIKGIKPQEIMTAVIAYDTLMDEYEQVLSKINDLSFVNVDDRFDDYKYMEKYDLHLGSEYFEALLKDLEGYRLELEDHKDLNNVPEKYHSYVTGEVDGSHTKLLLEKALKERDAQYLEESQKEWKDLEQEINRDEAKTFSHEEYLKKLKEVYDGEDLLPDEDFLKPQSGDEIYDVDLEGLMDNSFIIKRNGKYLGVTIANYSLGTFKGSKKVIIFSPRSGKLSDSPVDIIKSLNEIRDNDKLIEVFDKRARTA